MSVNTEPEYYLDMLEATKEIEMKRSRVKKIFPELFHYPDAKEIEALDNISINVTCPFCKESRKIVCNERGYKAWKSGQLIQRAFPTLSASDREGLITGICDSCFP